LGGSGGIGIGWEGREERRSGERIVDWVNEGDLDPGG